MNVAAIWRYPVKTMAGEPLERAAVGPLGIEGDRIVNVEDREGRIFTSRTHPEFLKTPRHARRGRRAAGRRLTRGRSLVRFPARRGR